MIAANDYMGRETMEGRFDIFDLDIAKAEVTVGPQGLVEVASNMIVGGGQLHTFFGAVTEHGQQIRRRQLAGQQEPPLPGR